MKQVIDLYWDVGSTNSYFALHLLTDVASRNKAAVRFHPFNLGYVFRKLNYRLQDEPREKLRYRAVDLKRWAVRHNLPFQVPKQFPIKTSLPLRGSLAMRRYGLERSFVEAIFAAYWEKGDASISVARGLRPIAASLGVSPDDFEELSESPAVRSELVQETDSGLARGAFGAPTMFVGNEMFWGKDRMDFLEEALRVGASRRPV